MFDKLTMQTKDLAQENIKKLADLFPECVTESKDGDKTVYSIDFDVLKKLLGDSIVEGYKERYQFTWPDKSKTMDFLLTPSTKTLRPCRAESVDFDHTKNLYIEGDNLEVLKLIRETYLGKIKMIYIDPPYNTGNDFIYKDNFKLSDQEYSKIDGNLSDAGDRLFENLPTNGRYHTDWLNMIYPRLLLAKSILNENGIIFISIDDYEVTNLRKVCDEIFGYNNFVSEFIWKKKQGGGNDSDLVVVEHEYIIAYAKDVEKLSLNLDLLHKPDSALYPHKDTNGEYGLITLDKASIRFSQSLVFEIKDPAGNVYLPRVVNGKQSCWRWSKQKVEQDYSNLVFKDGKVYTKSYKPKGVTPRSLLVESCYGRTETGSDDIKKLFGSKPFDYPKPVVLLKHLVSIGSNSDDTILDFFSGSSTTAQAILELNEEQQCCRKFIMIQLPELIQSKDASSNNSNICAIGKERIRLVGKEIHKKIDGSNVDTGFRVLKLDSSNMNSVYYNPNEIRQSIVEYSVDNIKSDRTNEDLLFQAMIEFGIDLSSPISKSELCGKEVFNVDNGYLIACFDENISDDVITEIAKKKPIKFVIRDKSLASDSVAINFEQIFKTYSPNTSTKVL